MNEQPHSARSSLRQCLLSGLQVLLIFAVFFIQGGWRPPLANEPHYLGKAKHYWNPDWCSRDFFLQSADAHQVFYWSFGWLSRYLTLPQLAWCGRILIWLLLAWAWTRISRALLGANANGPGGSEGVQLSGALVSVLSAALFAMLLDRCHMAGEWVIGGVEAKGFAYVFVFFALEAILLGRWPRVWLLLGAATAFHVLVGGWAAVAAFVAWLCCGKDRLSLTQMLSWMLLGGLIALPGLWAAMKLTWGVPGEIVSEANRIYVFDRIPHHLLIHTFGTPLIVRHALLIVAFLALSYSDRADARARRLNAFVLTAIALTIVGVLITFATWDHPDIAATLLRYYWFRLGDVMVPVGVALLFVRRIAYWQPLRPRWSSALAAGAALLVAAHFGELLFRRTISPEPPGDAAMVAPDEWRATCRWAAQNTPVDALFIVPRLATTFRWYAGRAEVVARKDVPQDAVGIVEWNRRLRDIFYTGLGAEGFTNSPARLGADRLRLAAQKYGADFVITRSLPPLPFKLVSPAGGVYAVYRLPTRAAAQTDRQVKD